MKKPMRNRLLERVVVAEGSDCWEWQRARNDQGYGHIYANGRVQSAHRISYEVFTGPIPAGLTVDHLCRNPGCINPAHLECVPMRENILRGTGPAAQNARRTTCLRGHPLSGENLYVEPKTGRRKCRACKRTRPEPGRPDHCHAAVLLEVANADPA